MWPRSPRTERRAFHPDAESTVFALCDWQPEPSRAPAVVLLHGLGGSATSGYMLGTADKAFARGFSTVRLNFRGAADTDALAPVFGHSAFTSDVRHLARELRDCVPRIHLVGFSLGANLALRAAIELTETGLAPAAVAVVSPAIDLPACSAAIDGRPENRLYRAHFLRRLRARARRRAKLFPGTDDRPAAWRARTLAEFDDAFTAPLGGFFRSR